MADFCHIGALVHDGRQRQPCVFIKSTLNYRNLRFVSRLVAVGHRSIERCVPVTPLVDVPQEVGDRDRRFGCEQLERHRAGVGLDKYPGPGIARLAYPLRSRLARSWSAVENWPIERSSLIVWHLSCSHWCCTISARFICRSFTGVSRANIDNAIAIAGRHLPARVVLRDAKTRLRVSSGQSQRSVSQRLAMRPAASAAEPGHSWQSGRSIRHRQIHRNKIDTSPTGQLFALEQSPRKSNHASPVGKYVQTILTTRNETKRFSESARISA